MRVNVVRAPSHVCIHCMCAHGSIVWRSESNLWEIVPSFHHVGMGIECRPSRLAESIITILLVWKGDDFNLCKEVPLRSHSVCCLLATPKEQLI